MNIHEYQAKKILQKYGIPVPEFRVASSIEDIERILQETEWTSVVLKVQVHAGGRGKAGGVRFAEGKEKIIASAREMLGMKIVNQQTGVEGMVAHQLLISPPLTIAKEAYLGVTIDREKGGRVLIASPMGGMDIEEVAHKSPEKVLILPIPLDGVLRPYHYLRLSKFMKWAPNLAQQGEKIVAALIKTFIETDAVLLEINPLVEVKEGKLYALDAKLVIDDNALFRQPEISTLFDPTQVTSAEAQAHQYELAYVALDGDIGCMVNGAGLAMATMDLIKVYGGRPANFLDVGGGASKEKVAEGFKIILSDPKIKGILVNIFGGIMNCETLAEGIIAAAKDLQIRVPLVVRMEGTNVEKGKELLEKSRLKIQIADHLTEAAKQIVSLAKG